MTQSAPRASVVIPTKNAGPLFREVLDALRGQELFGGFEVLVVDSGSTDGTAELAEKLAERVLRIPPAEFNHGRTRNLAVSRTRGEFVALLVQDATPADKNWLSRLVDCFADPQVAGAYSRQIPRPDCPPLIRARLHRWSASRAVREVKFLADPLSLYALPEAEQIRLLSFDNVSSCVRRAVWEELPFPELEFGEDLAWARAALFLGYRTVYEPGSAVIHSHRQPLSYEFKRVYLDHQNWNRLIGLKVFPRLRQALAETPRATWRAWADLRSEGVTGPALLYWMGYALPFALAMNLAQYWGANSNRWLRKRPGFRRWHDRLKKGV